MFTNLKHSKILQNKFSSSVKFGLIGLIINLLLALFANLTTYLLELAVAGFLIGLFVGLFEIFLINPKLRRKKFLFLILLRTFTYSVIILITAGILVSLKISVANQCSIADAFAANNLWPYLRQSNIHIIFIALIFLSFLINVIWQINQLLGPGLLLKYLTGKYHLPILEKRIFMFLDLKSSTTIAEKLGAEKYSSFLQDFFFDLTEPLLQTKGEIFQYCGDEVVIVWTPENGIKKNNVLKFFFLVEELMIKKRDEYLSKFGVYPEFKAGAHYGDIMITEVGDLKREIVYHGDLINTASRIRSTCNELNKRLLISDDLREILIPGKKCELSNVGEFIFKGKTEKVKLFSIDITNNNLEALFE